MVENGDVVFAKTASVGKCALIKGLTAKATINPQLVVLKKIACNPAYLSYLMNSFHFQAEVRKITGIGSVPNVSQSALSKVRIPIPPLELQEKIVAILDRFETLVNDLNEGLPREIELRRKQYEHYRDRLLAFPDISRPGTKQRI